MEETERSPPQILPPRKSAREPPRRERRERRCDSTTPYGCGTELMGWLSKKPRVVLLNGKERFTSPLHRLASNLTKDGWSKRLFHITKRSKTPDLLRDALNVLNRQFDDSTAVFGLPTPSMRLPKRWSVKRGVSRPRSYEERKVWNKKNKGKRKSLTRKVSSGIKAFAKNKEESKDDWLLSWFDVEKKERHLVELFDYVLHNSAFYHPKRNFPCNAFGYKNETTDAVGVDRFLRWAKRVRVVRVVDAVNAGQSNSSSSSSHTFTNPSSRQYVCETRRDDDDDVQTISIPWYQVVAKYDQNKIVRVLVHRDICVGDTLFVADFLTFHMSWEGMIRERGNVSTDPSHVGLHDDEFEENENKDMFFDVHMTSKTRSWIESLDKAALYLGGEPSRHPRISLQLPFGKEAKEPTKSGRGWLVGGKSSGSLSWTVHLVRSSDSIDVGKTAYVFDFEYIRSANAQFLYCNRVVNLYASIAELERKERCLTLNKGVMTVDRAPDEDTTKERDGGRFLFRLNRTESSACQGIGVSPSIKIKSREDRDSTILSRKSSAGNILTLETRRLTGNEVFVTKMIFAASSERDRRKWASAIEKASGERP